MRDVVVPTRRTMLLRSSHPTEWRRLERERAQRRANVVRCCAAAPAAKLASVLFEREHPEVTDVEEGRGKGVASSGDGDGDDDDHAATSGTSSIRSSISFV